MQHENRGIYRDKLILRHSKNPHNYGMITHASACAERASPTCGDVMSVYLVIDDQQSIQKIHFDGSLCAIATASASIMTEVISTLSVHDAQRRITEFSACLKNNQDMSTHFITEELTALNKAYEIAGRQYCVTLPWKTLQDALTQI